MKRKELHLKYKDIILYGVFGALTTAVNISAYWFMAHPLKINTVISTVIAWALAVLFAYGTNRRWVFHSKADTRKKVIREIISFFGCRLATGVIDWSLMLVCVEVMCWNDMGVKAGANIIVIILNYIFSKQVVFENRRDGKLL